MSNGMDVKQALSQSANSLPSFSPLINIAETVGQRYIQGKNPTDFRGVPIINKDNYTAGGKFGNVGEAKDIGMWMLHQGGVFSQGLDAVIGKPGKNLKMNPMESIIMRTPGLNSMLKFSNGGENDIKRALNAEANQKKAQARINANAP
jgi:hypothetical protein